MALNYTVLHRATDECPLSADKAFGPVVAASCRQGFDFTLMFEQSILSIGPSSILLVLLSLRLYWLYHSDVKVLPHASLYNGKVVSAPELRERKIKYKFWLTKGSTQPAITLFAGLQLALLILWAGRSTIQTLTSVPSAILSFIDALAIYQLSHVEHTRSVRPSTLLNMYLLTSLVFDIPQARTLFLRPGSGPIAAVFTASICTKLMLLTLEAQNKQKHLKHPYRDYPPEAISGIWNRTFFWWLNSLFLKGFRKLLSVEDLYSTDPGLSSEMLRDQMQSAWNRRGTLSAYTFIYSARADRPSAKPENRYALILACIKCLRWPLLSIIPQRLCLIGFYYAQPFLISRLISFVSEPSSPQNSNAGLGLIAAAALIYTGIAVSAIISARMQDLTKIDLYGTLYASIIPDDHNTSRCPGGTHIQ